MSHHFGTRPVVVTGASGFLGAAVLKQLGKSEVPVIAMSRQSRTSSSSTQWVVGDLLDTASLSRCIPDEAVVLHLGATIAGSAHDIHHSIVEGTRNLVEVTQQRGGRLVHVSSLAVIDPRASHSRGTVDESSPLDARPHARGAYSHAKVLADRLVQDRIVAGTDAVVVRPGQLVGRGLTAVPASVGIIKFDHLLMLAAPHWGIPLVHVNDAATGIILAATSCSGSIFHLVDEQYVRRDALLAAMRLASIGGASLPVWHLHLLAQVASHLPGGTARRLVALDTRARFTSMPAIAMGWQPTRLSHWLKTGEDLP